MSQVTIHGGKLVRVPDPSHARLLEIQDELRRETGRKGLSLGEVIENLIDVWDEVHGP